MTPIISAKKLVKRYGSNAESDVLKEVNIDIFPGESLAIVGASGAGKSTLLNLLGLLDVPTSGAITYSGRASKYSGRNLISLSQKGKAHMRNYHFSFIFQLYHLLPDLSMLENIMLPELISAGFFNWRKTKKKSRQKALKLIEEMGLSHRTHAQPSELSGGEKQRAAIARALVTEPEIVFCDEPTGNLDTVTSNKVLKLLWHLNKEHKLALVIVTHEKHLAENADRTLHMIDGKLH